MSLNNLISVEKATKSIENIKFSLTTQNIPLEAAYGRVVAENISALLDAPPFDRAAMDGYAVRSTDTTRSSPENPVRLDVVDDIGAGESSNLKLNQDQAVRIATGAPIPPGSDAVIMKENVEESDLKIKVTEGVNIYQDVALKGEDFRKGEVLLSKGQLLNPNQIALAASAGFSKMKVIKEPVIGIINTGNELIEPTINPKPNMIINSNKYALIGLIDECLAIPHQYLCKDNLEDMIKQLKYTLGRCDAVITTGGTAISRGDVVLEAVQELGEVILHGVSIKPGKPFGFGIIDGKPIFMLSGYPVAAAVQFDFFVRPALFKMQGIEFKADLKEFKVGSDIKSAPGKYTVMRAHLKDEIVYPIRTKAGINKSITNSNCYLIMDEHTGKIKKGEF
jgi:molybdopterin molybdotransferase